MRSEHEEPNECAHAARPMETAQMYIARREPCSPARKRASEATVTNAVAGVRPRAVWDWSNRYGAKAAAQVAIQTAFVPHARWLHHTTSLAVAARATADVARSQASVDPTAVRAQTQRV